MRGQTADFNTPAPPNQPHGNDSRRDFPEIPPPNITYNITYYDWSVSDDDYLEHHQYDYKDTWWVTIRDPYKKKALTKNPIIIDTGSTEKVETTSANDVTSNSSDMSTTVTSTTGHQEDMKDNVRVTKDLTRSGKHVNIIDNFKEIIDKDEAKTEHADGLKARAKALQRNRQIQRILVEVVPVNKTTPKLDMIAVNAHFDKLKQNHSLNLKYNKVIENFQLNVDGNVVNEFGNIHLDQIKQIYDLNKPSSPQVEVPTPVHRQGILPEDMKTTQQPTTTTSSPDLLATLYLTFTSTPVYNGPWTFPTTVISDMVNELMDDMKYFHTGYFTTAAKQAALSVSGKTDSQVRLLSLSVVREYHLLIEKDKYILSFGQPFLSTLANFTHRFHDWPPDFIRYRAQSLEEFMINRRQYLDHELNAILDYVDSLYLEEEGVNLFKAIDTLHKFPNTNETSFEVMRMFSKAVFAPYIRLSTSPRRQVLIDAVNIYIYKVNTAKPVKSIEDPDNLNYYEHYNLTYPVRRRLSNKTRFDVVGRDNNNNKNSINIKHIKHDSRNEDKHKKHMNKTNKLGPNKGYKNTKGSFEAQAEKHILTKHEATRKKTHHTKHFKHKHPEIYNRYKHLKRKSHQKHNNRKEKFKNFKNRLLAKKKHLEKINGYEKYSQMKAKRLKNKFLRKISKINDDSKQKNKDEYGTDETDDHYEDDLNDSVSKTDYSESKLDPKDKKSSIKPISKSTSRLHTTRNISRYKINSKISILTKTVTETPKNTEIFNNHDLSEYGETSMRSVKLLTSKKSDFEIKYGSLSNKNSITTTKHVDKKEITIENKPKNKVTQTSSYSDEEDLLRFKISDALRHDKEYYRPIRRSNLINMKKRINHFSSYSSEEVILKSNIYKSLGFQKFVEPNKVELRANDNNKPLKIKFQKFRPVNKLSSYSDEEEILWEKLNVNKLKKTNKKGGI